MCCLTLGTNGQNARSHKTCVRMSLMLHCVKHVNAWIKKHIAKKLVWSACIYLFVASRAHSPFPKHTLSITVISLTERSRYDSLVCPQVYFSFWWVCHAALYPCKHGQDIIKGKIRAVGDLELWNVLRESASFFTVTFPQPPNLS